MNLSREARNPDGWDRNKDTAASNVGLVFDGDGFCYWSTNTPW